MIINTKIKIETFKNQKKKLKHNFIFIEIKNRDLGLN